MTNLRVAAVRCYGSYWSEELPVKTGDQFVFLKDAKAVESELENKILDLRLQLAKARSDALEEAAELCQLWNKTPGKMLAIQIRKLKDET